MPRYENTTTGKYIEIIESGYIREGELNASTPRHFVKTTIDNAKSITDKHLASGYVDAGLVGTVWDFEPNARLENKIRDSIDNAKAYLDYAHWLNKNGQKEFGNLIKSNQSDLSYEEYRLYFGEMRFENDIIQWRHGFIQTFESVSNRSTIELNKFLRLPPLIFLESLNMWQTDIPELLHLLSDWRGLQRLKKLNLWDEQELGIGDYSFILPKLKHLQYFYLVGTIFKAEEDEPELGEFDFPELTHFARVSPDLSERELHTITTATWPKLESLTLGIGFESNIIAGDFKFLLNGDNFRSIKYLSIRHFTETDTLILLLAKSTILAQLVKLDFYQSDLTHNGVKALIDNKDKFNHLEEIGIRETTLTQKDEATLSATFHSIHTPNPFRELGDIPYIEGIYQEDFWEQEV
ncbi:hypothetical protein MNBD_GAMMA12-3817 [hydrothermal vent metagenome]|uniref:Uncharacterized protein n=1 Tax=hydrothermal vent metagenome TaxID=652676 RepID=A0A3B0YBE3_9ZZZZ